MSNFLLVIWTLVSMLAGIGSYYVALGMGWMNQVIFGG
jgi:hypothetical protein